MSPNGRYFTADSLPFSVAKYLDAETGAIADLPAGLIVSPVVRDVANDGTALLSIAQSNDPQQYNARGTLALWKPCSDLRTIYSETQV